MRLPLGRKLFLSHFLAVVLVSGSVGSYFYQQAHASLLESLRARLRQSAGLLARTLDATELADLRTAEDVARPSYARHLALLRDFRAANRDVAFIYVMRLDGGDVRFVLDSDDGPEQARPGAIYAEAPDTLRRGFVSPTADDHILQDRWGYFLSGYAPIKNGEGSYLVGLDMRADEVARKFQRIRIAGGVSLVASLVAAALFSRFLARRITRPLTQVVRRAGEIAHGELAGELAVRTGDELEELGGAIDRMAADLLESQRRRDQAMDELEQVNVGLEQRIAERTLQLSETNAALRLEIEERKRAEVQLEHAASSDFLTGLLNRPAMLRLMELEAERMRRTTAPFSLALADLDSFKPINDRYGHAVGDEVLTLLAATLRGALRGQDAVGRWGGDEILIFLPETPLAGALEVAEKIRQRLAGAVLRVEEAELRMTLSLGVAEARAGEPIGELVRRADEALYRAKLDGRNRVSSGS